MEQLIQQVECTAAQEGSVPRHIAHWQSDAPRLRDQSYQEK
jgi:hypothetical protein